MYSPSSAVPDAREAFVGDDDFDCLRELDLEGEDSGRFDGPSSGRSMMISGSVSLGPFRPEVPMVRSSPVSSSEDISIGCSAGGSCQSTDR